MPMKPSDVEYEELVSDIVNGIKQSAFELHELQLGFNSRGHLNRILGASGFNHQIDVSLKGTGHIFIFECKHWRKSIGVAEVLILASRKNDIQACYPEREVKASMVSICKPSRNIPGLAKHFGIEIEMVTSGYEYGLRIAARVHQAVVSQMLLTDTAICEQKRGGIQI